MDKKAKQYKYTFEEGAGAAVLADLRKMFYDVPSYTKGDPTHTAFLEGKREVIRYILSMRERQVNEE